MNRLSESKSKNFQEFVEYFQACEDLGIPTSLNDLVMKAEELNLPIPNFDKDYKLDWN